MSYQQERTVDLLMKAGAIYPTTVTKNRERHQRADYKADIRPFASGMDWACALVVGGITLGAFATVTLYGRAAGALQPDETFISTEAALLALAMAAVAYGIGYSWQMTNLTHHYLKRLYRHDEQHTQYTTAPKETSKSPAIFLQTGRTTSRIPDIIDIHNLMKFCRAVLNGKMSLSEASAAHFGLGRAEWESFKSWAMSSGFIAWRNEANHRQGLVVAGPGGRAALKAIALGYYREQ